MFGLFRKKHEEPAPEATEEPEIWEDEEDGTFTILAVTDAVGFGGEKKDGDELWTASIGLTAWKEEDSDEPAHREETGLETRADDKLLEYLRRRVLKDSIIQVKVRRSEDGTHFLMEELPQPVVEPELKAILEEQKKPVTVWIPDIGTFTLNRSVGWFEAEVDWQGQTIRLDVDKGENWDACMENAKALLSRREEWDRSVRALAADQLLELANDWASDGGCEEREPEEITREDFMSRMELDAVQIDAAGHLDFWFDDGGLFWGHSIRVSGSLSGGPETAVMEG